MKVEGVPNVLSSRLNIDQRETQVGIKSDEDGKLSAASIRVSMTQWMGSGGGRGAESC